MRRRRFLGLWVGSAALGALGCVGKADDGGGDDGIGETAAPDAAVGAADAVVAAGDAAIGCDAASALVYDTYAQALYLDGSLGPLTGVIEAEYVAAGAPVELEFWHGHGGQQHRFTIGPQHFAKLVRGERVYIETTEVDSHSHMLFVDPTDPAYRVEDAEPVPVALETC